MTEVDASENLKDVLARRFFTQTTVVFLQFIQNCVVHVLKHQIETAFATEHLDHVHQVLVPQFL